MMQQAVMVQYLLKGATEMQYMLYRKQRTKLVGNQENLACQDKLVRLLCSARLEAMCRLTSAQPKS